MSLANPFPDCQTCQSRPSVLRLLVEEGEGGEGREGKRKEATQRKREGERHPPGDEGVFVWYNRYMGFLLAFSAPRATGFTIKVREVNWVTKLFFGNQTKAFPSKRWKFETAAK